MSFLISSPSSLSEMDQNVSVKIFLHSCYHGHLNQSLLRPLTFKLLAIKNGALLFLSDKLTDTSLCFHHSFLLLLQGLAQYVTYAVQGFKLEALTIPWFFPKESPITRIQGEAGFVIDPRRCHSGQIQTAHLICYFRMSQLVGKWLSWSSAKHLFICLTSFFPLPFQILP